MIDSLSSRLLQCFRPSWPWLCAALLFGFVASCDDRHISVENDGASSDGASDGGDHDGAGEAGDALPSEDGPHEAGADVGGEPVPGPITLVVRRAEMLADRLCDIDGDGQGDNSVAELGAPADSLFATILTQFIGGRIDEAGHRLMLHLPLVEDVTRPHDLEVFPIATPAARADEDPSDDFSGHEPLSARCDWEECKGIDACGEPMHFLENASIDRGRLDASGGTLVLPGISIASVHHTWGQIERGGASAEIDLCAFHRIEDLGGTFMIATTGGLSALEVLLYGGAVYGVPTVPGLVPDLDFDGDGLERFVLDEEGFIVSCIDGDRSEIIGNDCWSDPRMADGFSTVLRFSMVSAVFIGLQEGWEHVVEGECPDGPPEPSSWDPR